MVVSTALRDGTLVNVTCSYLDSGASVTVPGIQGQLVCPDVDFFCGTSGKFTPRPSWNCPSIESTRVRL